MNDFVSGFPDAAILDTLGDSISFVTKSGVVTQLKAILELDVITDEYNSEYSKQIEFLMSDLSSPIQRGDKIISNSKTYIIDSLLGRNEHYERWGLING